MKRIKVVLFLLLAVVIAGAAFTTNFTKRFTINNYKWIGPPQCFIIGVSDKGLLDDADKWTSDTSLFGGSIYLSYVRVIFTGTAPSKQQVIDEVKARYIANGETFVDGETWVKTINGVSVTFTIYLKNSC